MIILISVFLAALGAIFGSFIGAMTWRMKHHKDWVRGRSECEHCHHKLSPLDLVPIFSWLALRGKCRYCHKPIGATALYLELGTAAAFVISFLFWPNLNVLSLNTSSSLWPIVTLVIWLIALIIMIALLTYDARWRLLPNQLVYPLIGLALVFGLVNNLAILHYDIVGTIFNLALGLLPISGVYFILWLLSKGKWIGLGDVRLGLALGLMLPWQFGLLVLFLANTLSTLVVIPGLLTHKLKPNSQIPFGPYLIIATFLVQLLGQSVVDYVDEIFY